MDRTYMEAISEMVAKTKRYPIQTMKYPQTKPAVPPLMRAKVHVLYESPV